MSQTSPSCTLSWVTPLVLPTCDTGPPPPAMPPSPMKPPPGADAANSYEGDISVTFGAVTDLAFTVSEPPNLQEKPLTQATSELFTQIGTLDIPGVSFETSALDKVTVHASLTAMGSGEFAADTTTQLASAVASDLGVTDSSAVQSTLDVAGPPPPPPAVPPFPASPPAPPSIPPEYPLVRIEVDPLENSLCVD